MEKLRHARSELATRGPLTNQWPSLRSKEGVEWVRGEGMEREH
jgi:hypothetical protein